MEEKKVLIVDDSRTVRESVSVLLRTAGFAVAAAVDGRDGLLQIRSTPELALVLCDVNMPLMNGIEMLAALKREPPPRPVPVLMLTTDMEPAMIERGRAAGARGWLAKPFDPSALLSAVRKLTGAA